MKEKELGLFLLLILLPIISSQNPELTIMSSATFSFSESVSSYEKADDYQELQQMIVNYKREIDAEREDVKMGTREIFENQDKIKIAVYSLLSMEKLIPSVGIIVSDLTIQINDSFTLTTDIENRIKSRGSLSRFFIGGNFKLADRLHLEIISIKDKFSLLEELSTRCSNLSEVEIFFNEQLHIIEEEQNRLQELVLSEKSSKGIIGWIWK
jgi:hypothetical protein